jgi:hypothetical protein
MNAYFPLESLKKRRWQAAACLFVVAAPYWALALGPGEAGLGARAFAVAAALVLDALLLLGIRWSMRPRPEGEKTDFRFMLFLMAAITFYFLVAFRNTFGAMILFASEKPDLFLATPNAAMVAVLMLLGLAFTAYEFVLVGKLSARSDIVSTHG